MRRQSTTVVPGFFAAGEQMMRVILLNAVWLVACLPLLTIFPATAALFGVTRERAEHGEPRIIKPFIRSLRLHFLRAFIVGLIATPIAAILVLDLAYIAQADRTPVTYMVFTVTIWVTLAYAATATFLFPVLNAAPQATWWAAVRISALMSLRHPRVTLLTALMFVAAAMICYFVPYAIAVAPSAVAHGTYRICGKPIAKELGRTTGGRLMAP